MRLNSQDRTKILRIWKVLMVEMWELRIDANGQVPSGIDAGSYGINQFGD
jgi:hypothetical protein